MQLLKYPHLLLFTPCTQQSCAVFRMLVKNKVNDPLSWAEQACLNVQFTSSETSTRGELKSSRSELTHAATMCGGLNPNHWREIKRTSKFYSF